MPFLPAGVGAAVAGGVASAAVGAGISALTAGGQSSAISSGAKQATEDLQPYVSNGENALSYYGNAAGTNGPGGTALAEQDFTGSPGYAWSLSQGLRGIDAGAASTGTLRSGSTIDAEDKFSQGLANQDFQNYMGNLNTLAQGGLSAAGGQANVATGAAGALSNITGAEGSGISTALGTGAGAVTNGLANYYNPNNSSASGYDTTTGSLSGTPQSLQNDLNLAPNQYVP